MSNESEQVQEVMELSLEKAIETKLIQSNLTEQVLAALKEKYGGMKLKSVDDKESYLELKAAAKDCAKVRTLAVKVCTEGRERAVKEQKLWIAEQKRVVGEVATVEDPLDAEIKKYDDNIERIKQEEKNKQEEAYINRQATITKMGATYIDGNFVLGSASFEANLIKGSSDDVWEEAIVPKFREEYEKIEAVRLSEEKQKKEEADNLKRQQDELEKQKAELKAQQDELQKQKEEAERTEQKRISELLTNRGTVLRGLGMSFDGSKFDFADIFIDKNTITSLPEYEWTTLVSETTVKIKEVKDTEAKKQEEKRLADIETAKQEAIKKEQERQAEETRLADLKKKQDEEKKQAELEAANDKTKWTEFVTQVKSIQSFEMKSSQYKNKMKAATEKISEILAL